MNYTIEGLFAIGILGVCFSFIKMMNGDIKGKVTKSECHVAQNGIKQRIDDLQGHIDTRFKDMKDFIKKNGNGGR